MSSVQLIYHGSQPLNRCHLWSSSCDNALLLACLRPSLAFHAVRAQVAGCKLLLCLTKTFWVTKQLLQP